MTNKNLSSFLRLGLLAVLLTGIILQPQFRVYAAAQLTITPLTWNVIGLDSNNVNVGPNNFPVGARVCNTGDQTANNVSSAFNWEAVDPTPAKDYIQLRPGSNPSYSGYTLAPSACVDFYYEVQVTRDSNAYKDTRRYYITATADTLGTVSTPRPRELFIEHLISQNRNSVTDVRLNGVSVAAGGTMNLMVGNTYDIQLRGNTATQGYEQIESFINFPNTIFRVNFVTSTFSANAGTDPLAGTRPYADGCTWVNDPGAPNYRSCVSTGKYGGSVTVNYNVTIIGGAGASQTLNTLIYDFSGSSYHYNADFSTSARFVSIFGPGSIGISKTFTPKAISPGATSVLTFRLTNPTTQVISGANFTDTLMGGLTVASTPGISYSGCGSGAFSPVPVSGSTSLSFSSGTIGANSTCTISINVTAASNGTYPNVSGNLFINTTTNTGNTASDTLTVSSAAACVPGQTLATWTFPSGSSATTPAFTSRAANVATALASTTTSSPAIETNASYGNPAPSWGGQGFTAGAYFQFQVDTSKYTNVTISFDHIQTTASWNVSTVTVASSTDGSTFSSNGSATLLSTMGSSTFNTTANSTYFRISATGAQNVNSRFAIDNVTFTGCLVPAPAPTISKTFLSNPIVQGAASVLRFTISNTAAGNVAQSGISFSDVLPAGLSITSGTTSVCGGTNNLTRTAATRTIALSGGSLSAGGSCTFDVTVTGTAEGVYENVTGFLSSTESGTTTSYATAPLTVIAPPTLSKAFSPTSIKTGETSSLSFSIYNPNPSTTLTGIGFTDILPAGVTAVNGTTSVCGGSLQITGGNTLTFSGGSISSNSTCIFPVTVTGTTPGTKVNTTSTVSSTEGGTGNSASATLVVSDPQPLIGLIKQISMNGATWEKYVGLVPTQDIYYRFTVTNDGETALDTISVTDPNVNLAACTPALPTSLAAGDSASCVIGPISISAIPSPNPFVNTASVTTTTYSPGPEGTSSAQYGTKSLTLDKTADRSTFAAAGEVITYSYLVTNSGGYPLLGPVTVSDDKATVTCPEVNTVGDLDSHLDPGESLTCTATYSVTAGDVTAGRVTNTATATVDGVVSNADSVTVSLPPDLTASKTNNVSGSLALGGSFNWTITVTNSGVADAVFADASVILSDALPGAAGYYPQGTLTVTPGSPSHAGTINCSITGTALSCAASGVVTIPEDASFGVTFAVTPTVAGSLANTASADPGNVVTESDEANNTGSNTVAVVGPPSIAKAFSPNPIAVGGTSTLTFTITNSNTATALTGVGFTDPLPTGLEVSAPANATASAGCGSPTFAPSAGATTLTFSGGTIPASGTCTVTVDITATTTGTKNNTTGGVSSTNGGTGNTASASLGVVSVAKTILSTSEPATGFVSGFERVVIGEVIRYRLTTELPEGTWTNVQITDAIDAGLLFLNDGTASISFICDGACTNSSFTITPAAFSSGTDPVFDLGTVTNSDNDVNAEYLVVELNALMLNMASNNSGGFTRNNSYSISFNGTTISSPDVGVRVVEPVITNLLKAVTPSTGPYHPGDTITYTLTFSNGATGVSRATAFDVFLTDALSADLDLQNVSVTAPTSSTATDTSTLGVAGVVRVLVDQLPPAADISSGPTGVTVTVTAQIVNTASGGTLSNTASLTFTGLPGGSTTGDVNGTCPNVTSSCTPGTSGSLTGERNGTGGSPNTYADTSTLDITVTPSADLGVTKTDGAATYSPGGSLTYTITVTNNGPSGVTGASFSDSIPSQFTGWAWTCVPGTGASCTPGPSASSADFSDTVDLPSGSSVTYTVDATISSSASGDLVNTATITTPVGVTDTVPGNNSSTDTNTFVGIPALTIAKTETSTGPYAAGDAITYSVVVTNTGSTTLTSVVVNDPQLTPDSETCASLLPGDTCTLSGGHTVTQTDFDTGSFVNTASVTDDDVCPAAGAGTCEDGVTVTFSQTPGLTLTKTAAPSTVTAVGDVVTYTFSVQNTGNVTLTNITLSDTLLSGLTCTPIASLAPGASQSFTCTGNTYTIAQTDLDDNGGGDGDIDNTATAAGTPPGGGTTSDTDSAAVTLPAQNPAINIAKTPATQNVISGGTASFTLTLTNTGNVTLSGIVVTDALCTTGPTFIGGDANSDSQLQVTETWTYSCSVDNVTADFTNTASVTTTQGATDSDSADVTVTVLQADLSLDKGVSNSTPLVATNIDFTLSVTNSGPDTASNVEVTDVLPVGFAYVTHSATQGTYDDSTGVWDVGTLLLNQTETLTITVTVGITGPYTNYAEITASDVVDPDSTPDNDSTNEDDDDSVTVTPTQNDPSLGKTVSSSNQAFTTSPSVAIGEIVEYTVTVNVPPGIFTNARLVDTMERGLSFAGCSGITESDPALTTDVAGSFSGACSSPAVDDAGGGTTVDVARRVTFDLGTVTNASGADQTLTFVYTAVVLDSAGNVSGTGLDNSAVWASDSGSRPPAVASLLIVEPDLSIVKTANTSLVSVGSEITITLTIRHTTGSEVNAYDAAVTDVLPAELELVAGTLECVSGAQDANTCSYDAGTRTVNAIWDTFTRGGGDGRVTFRVRVASLPTGGISNVANVAWTSLPGDVGTPQNSNTFSTERDYDPASQIDVYGASDRLVIGVFNSAPATGFAPNVVTDLRGAPQESYAQTGGLTVAVPSLGVSIPIVGVPLRNGEWNVSWLGNQAGWLEGSAFPSWSGNSVLTGHVYGANGLPGPFVNLSRLKYGDKIIIRAYGQTFTYEVRVNVVVEPNDTSIFRHEEKSWLTLVTCKEYDEKTKTYRKRVVVRAVLVNVSGK